jgi:uncharacterized protein YdeI (BOF family)
MRRNFILASFAIVGLVACRNPSLDKQTQVREKPIETGQANPTTTSTPLAPTNPKIAQISNPESISGEVVRVEEDDIILNNGTQEIRVDADDDVLQPLTV